MLYSNEGKNTIERELSFGKVRGISLGEFGRGRQETLIPTPNDLQEVLSGMTENIVVGLSKSGRPRFNYGVDEKLYLTLYTYDGYTRRGDGYVAVLERDKEKVKILARGNGADGDAGRIGSWDEILLEVSSFPCIVRVRYSGGNKPSDILIINSNKDVVKLKGVEEVQLYYDNLDDFSPIRIDDDGFVKDDWLRL